MPNKQTSGRDYSAYSKDFTVIVSRWEIFKAWLFGEKFEEPRITAYYYKNKFYITRLR